MNTRLFLAAATLALVAGAAAQGATRNPIASATSAAPAAIGAHASVMTMDGKVLRKGTNGWTCMPDDPGTPGNDPMCLDRAGMAWLKAWMAKKTPPATPGFAYMLQGGSDASNLDPFLEKPAAGQAWVATGPHIMILSASAAAASGYPSGEAKPDTRRPYIMYGGTPYAHIMFPTR